MKIRAEPQGSYFIVNLRRRKTGERKVDGNNYFILH